MNRQDQGRALEAIATLLAGFPSSNSAIGEATAMAYLRAVDHCPLVAIEAACTAFLRGQVAGHNLDFAPTAPRLAALADALAEAARALSEGPRLVRYRMGESPPEGTVALGGRTDDWRGPSRVRLIAGRTH
ncbi:MAG TPA: hypothetical protein VGV07_22120 [Devosia sp.]|jgi:hypothetical protein|uniref:hypothetical protein n=1 Tax=Devosia sp. TaxID=1871048 RepID=UPI002DDD3B53|nr:hypothetical protein [Devosia sp.]HEV2517964.1 hypothetical protein [Devosia sp.]